MFRKIIILTIVATVVFSTVKAQTSLQFHDVRVGDFNAVQVVDNINVLCVNNPDSAGWVSFTCAPEAVSSVTFSVNKGKLKLERNLDVNLDDEQLPVVTVYSSDLSSVENWGDGYTRVINPPRGDKFKAHIIGNGEISVVGLYVTQTEGRLDTGRGHLLLQGTTRSVNLKNIGTGTINAFELKAETGSVKNYGTGSIECNVTGDLNISGLGTGKIYVMGHPRIKKYTLSRVQVVELD